MINDPIVEEVRRYRKEHAAQYGNDLNRIVDALKKKERESSRVYLNPGPKPLSQRVLQRISTDKHEPSFLGG